MYLLCDADRTDWIGDLPDTETVCVYPSRILVRSDTVPAKLPADAFEILDDPNIRVHGQTVEIRDGSFDLGDGPHTLVRFIGPMAPAWRRQLASRKTEILFWCPRFGACIRFPANMDASMLASTFPFIAGARTYRAEDCTRGLAGPSGHFRRLTGLPADLIDIVCFGREDRLRVEAELAGMGIQVLARSSSKLRVRFEGDRTVLRDIVGVKLVDDARAPMLLASSALMRSLGPPGESPDADCPFTGRGQIVAVADSGLDCGTDDENLHEDFRGRVRHIGSLPINPSWAPYVTRPDADDGAADRNSGHGTHVAGLVLGSGTKSGGRHRGVAPEAELVFQAIEQFTDIDPVYRGSLPSGYYLSGRPLDLRELFEGARGFGARIHVNAWGDAARGQYTDDCFEADLFLRHHPDALILFAAGNEGADRDGNRQVDPRSLYAPASAKNVVAVGAVEGAAGGVGLRGTWADLDPQNQRFRNPADRQDPISGEQDRIALFSSAGPTADGRIKPDLCAPGTNLAAPRSSLFQGRGWGLASPLPHYMYLGGTSMATGVAGGFAALLREAWQERFNGRAPSGMAIKALMLLGARPVRSRRGDDSPEPPSIAGFGRLHLAGCLPGTAGVSLSLHDELEPGLAACEKKTYPLRINTAGPFKAVLTWYDAPGETLVNDLDLCLVSEQGERVWGNHAVNGDSGPDRINSVEQIDIPDLSPGTYRLEVIGANVPEPPQPFALAVSHPAPCSCDLPTAVLKGIGKAYAQRLTDNGITRINQLFSRKGQLADLLQSRPHTAELLGSRLVLLESIISSGRPQAIPPAVTLAMLLKEGPAAENPPAAWSAAKQLLMPLRLVFDKGQLSRISLRQLFG